MHQTQPTTTKSIITHEKRADKIAYCIFKKHGLIKLLSKNLSQSIIFCIAMIVNTGILL